MSERIRWEPLLGGNFDGYVGIMTAPMFEVYLKAKHGPAETWALRSDLLKGYSAGTHPDALKAEAEDWLERFVSSLGAVFPDEHTEMFADVIDEAVFRAQHEPGARVRFEYADAGYPADQKMAAMFLTIGEVYTIEWSDIGQSSTRLGLAGIDTRGQGFNSVLFEPADDEEVGK